MSSPEEATRIDDPTAARTADAAAPSPAPPAARSGRKAAAEAPASRDGASPARSQTAATEREPTGAQQGRTATDQTPSHAEREAGADAASEAATDAGAGVASEAPAQADAAATGSSTVEEPAFAPPSYLFLALVASVALLADAVTKAWAETTLSQRTLEAPSIVLIDDVLTFTLAYNTGGAFGMLAGDDGFWRRPFFLLMSIGASVFIVNVYRKVLPHQWALKWGLPLVLGGALGNLADRLTKGKVVDFIDYRAGWVETMNELIHRVNPSWYVTSHWPTFNVADICICIGVGLMAIDTFTSGGEPKAAADGREAPSAG